MTGSPPDRRRFRQSTMKVSREIRSRKGSLHNDAPNKKPVAAQNPLHRADRDADRLGHGRLGPVGGFVPGGLGQGQNFVHLGLPQRFGDDRFTPASEP